LAHLAGERPDLVVGLLREELRLPVESEQRLWPTARRNRESSARSTSSSAPAGADHGPRALAQTRADRHLQPALLEEQIRAYCERAPESGLSVALLLVDVDRFKRVNDSHGHQVRRPRAAPLAQLLQGAVRWSDLALPHRRATSFAVLWTDSTRARPRRRAHELQPPARRLRDRRHAGSLVASPPAWAARCGAGAKAGRSSSPAPTAASTSPSAPAAAGLAWTRSWSRSKALRLRHERAGERPRRARHPQDPRRHRLVDSTLRVERLGDERAAELSAGTTASPRAARAPPGAGDRQDRRLPAPVRAAVHAVASPSPTTKRSLALAARRVALEARAGIHVGEVFLREKPERRGRPGRQADRGRGAGQAIAAA